MHLLDTSVVVALRDARGRAADPGMVLWASSVARETLFLSVITLHELETQASDAAARDKMAGQQWRSWIDDHVLRAFEGRILAVDAPVVRRAAMLGYGEPRDGLLAATALVHGLTLTTLRPRAFRAGRVKVFDPIGYAPESAVEDWRQAARATPGWVKNLFVRS
jgi:predicted nucleic acid-binding protein